MVKSAGAEWVGEAEADGSCRGGAWVGEVEDECREREKLGVCISELRLQPMTIKTDTPLCH